jgi:hypothetical protein
MRKYSVKAGHGARITASAPILIQPLLFADWRGSLLAWLSVVWVAGLYMSLFDRLRLDIKHEHIEIAASETEFSLQKGPSMIGERKRISTASS